MRDDNPAAPIRLRQPKAPIKEPFTEEELRALVSATENLRDRAIILMFIATGCRISEILSMRSADVSWESGSILVRGKGQRHRYVIPGRLAMKALDRYLDGRTGALWINYFGDPLCQPGCYLMIRNLGERVGVKAYPHRFRTTFACMFNRLSNGDIQSLQILMGHAKVSTTLHYAAHGAVQRALEQQRRLSLADRIGA